MIGRITILLSCLWLVPVFLSHAQQLQPLSAQLLKLAEHYRLQVLFSPNIVEGLLAAPVEEFQNVEADINQLLSGTSLQLLKLSDSAYVIQKRLKQNNTKVKPAQPSHQTHTNIERIKVLGSHITPADPRQSLPVTILDTDFISASGAMSGREMLASIPQVGEIPFNNERAIGGVNDARGDVSSINLRSLGTGYTLTLLNGRRMVQHPVSQTENYVPVTTANVNSIPLDNLSRIEVLLDGASALYGSDAVAGVVNYVTNQYWRQPHLSVSYAQDKTTALSQLNINANKSWLFNDDKTLFNLALSLNKKDGLDAVDREYSASQDRRSLLSTETAFLEDTQLDNRSGATPWGEFVVPSLGRVNIQPISNNSCNFPLSAELCLDAGSTPRSMRFDRAFWRSMTSDLQRVNLTSYINHKFNDNIEWFSELYWYQALSERQREQNANLSSQRFTISKEAYFNPFDEDLLLRRYRPLDTGVRDINVNNYAYRIVTGISGELGDWYWQAAGLYSFANAKDVSKNRIDAHLFQKAINQQQSHLAYNPFNGGDLLKPNTHDNGGNLTDVIATFLINPTRLSRSDIASIDASITNDQLFSLPGGDAAVAAGFELRQEWFADDRDSLLDGSSPFYDQVSGELLSNSRVLGSSYTPDSSGKRQVSSAYLELMLPISANFNVQLASRYEDFSDVGSVLKPKFSFTWHWFNNWSLRGSYSQGFKAPSLPQSFETAVVRVNSHYDPVVDVSYTMDEVRQGNPNLQPETNTNSSLGILYQSSIYNRFTLDWWQIEQQGIVGILPTQTLLLSDSLLTAQGQSHPAVQRGEDGRVTQVNNQYINLNPRKAQGLDVGFSFNKQYQGLRWRLSANAAYMLKFEQQYDALTQELVVAQQLNHPAVPNSIVIENAGSLLERNGLPKWRANTTSLWLADNWQFSMALNYIGSFYETSVVNRDGQLMPIDAFTTISSALRVNLGSLPNKHSLVFGINNLTNAQPPLADESFGYFSDIHSNAGRVAYLQFNWQF